MFVSFPHCSVENFLTTSGERAVPIFALKNIEPGNSFSYQSKNSILNHFGFPQAGVENLNSFCEFL